MTPADICRRVGATPRPVSAHDKLGVSRETLSGEWPVNGVRLAAEGGTCGWYIWSGGEMSDDDDFFVPLHVEHLLTARPEVGPYLSLPVGWRFLVAPNHEDVWFDAGVLS
jgi:hypothetical protein